MLPAPHFGLQFEGGEEVIESVAQRPLAEGVDPGRDRRVVMALVAGMLAHTRPIALLDVDIVVLLITPTSGATTRSSKSVFPARVTFFLAQIGIAFWMLCRLTPRGGKIDCPP